MVTYHTHPAVCMHAPSPSCLSRVPPDSQEGHAQLPAGHAAQTGRRGEAFQVRQRQRQRQTLCLLQYFYTKHSASDNERGRFKTHTDLFIQKFRLRFFLREICMILLCKARDDLPAETKGRRICTHEIMS